MLGARINFDLAIDTIDDPVDSDAGPPVDGDHRTILAQAGVGDFHDHDNILRTGLPFLGPPVVSS